MTWPWEQSLWLPPWPRPCFGTLMGHGALDEEGSGMQCKC